MGWTFVCPVLLSSCSLTGSGSALTEVGLVLFFSDRKWHVWVSLAGVLFPFFFLFHTLEESDFKYLVTDNIAIHYWYQARNLILNYTPCSDYTSSFALQTHLNTAPHSPSCKAIFCHYIYIYSIWVWIGILLRVFSSFGLVAYIDTRRSFSSTLSS